MAETAAQKKARLAAEKEARYIDSFNNPITSQYDPRISENPGVFGINGPTWQQLADEEDATAASKVDGATGPTGPTGSPVVAKYVSTYTDPETGDIIDIYNDGSEKIRKKGTLALDRERENQLFEDEKKAQRVSAYDLLLSEFKEYGLEALVTPLKSLIEEGVSPSEFTIRLRDTDAYKKRFAANAQRVAKGLRALSEAEYIGTEDQYQDVMRRYGLPESYYAKGDLGVQSGFEKFLAGDVSAVELEDRVQTAQNRVLNANPEIAQALKSFYPGISNGDILAYTLDPANAINEIKRKVTAAEIGGEAVRSGLKTNVADAEYLQRYGVTKQQAEQGYGTIAGGLQRGSQLASMYGEDPYTQSTAEQEVFNVPGGQDSRKQRQKIIGLEKATFGGQSGISSSALSRDRAGGY